MFLSRLWLLTINGRNGRISEADPLPVALDGHCEHDVALMDYLDKEFVQALIAMMYHAPILLAWFGILGVNGLRAV